MDEDALGMVMWIVISFGGLVVVAAGGVGIAYASDAALTATVVGKDCINSTISVETEMFGIEAAVEVSPEQCVVIQTGNYVKYHVRTEQTTIYSAKGGDCLWDTVRGYPC